MGTAARLPGIHRTYKTKVEPIHQPQMEPSPQTTSSSAAEVSSRCQQGPQGLGRHGISISQELEDSTMTWVCHPRALVPHHQVVVWTIPSLRAPTKLWHGKNSRKLKSPQIPKQPVEIVAWDWIEQFGLRCSPHHPLCLRYTVVWESIRTTTSVMGFFLHMLFATQTCIIIKVSWNLP